MKKPGRFDEKAVLDILKKYDCPTPYHKIRTIFLGNIATPVEGLAPFQVVKGLWGGELPPFDNIDAVNTMLEVLMGLWNHLGKHQSATASSRLTRPNISQDKAGLLLLATTRIDELEGFVNAMFAGQPEINLPESASKPMNNLSDADAIIMGIPPLLETLPQEEADKGAAETIKNVMQLSRHIEDDMHRVVVACARARQNLLAEMPTTKVTLH